jgi:hypothetical protein
MSDLFAGLERREIVTSEGKCELPILYKDASLFAALWRVDLAAAHARMRDVPFEPWLLFGKAIAMLCVFEYRDTTIGPYGELGVGILAKRPGTSPSWLGAARDLANEADAGIYVTNLPVTSERARAAGVELWGYPKYVTDIQTSFGEHGAKVVLGTELAVTLPLARKKGFATAGIPLVLFSVTPKGRMVRTSVAVDFRARWGASAETQTTLLGDGPTAETFRALSLDRQPPILAFRTDAMRAVLPLGVDMGEAPRRAGVEPLAAE